MYKINYITMDSDFFNLNDPFFRIKFNIEEINSELSKLTFYNPVLNNITLVTNGIRDKFVISNGSLYVLDFENVYLNSVYFTKDNYKYNEFTPLNYYEIIEYMKEIGFITRNMVFSNPINKSSVPKSNFLNIEYAKNQGFFKNSSLEIPEITIKTFNVQLDKNQILSNIYLDNYFINKEKQYNVNISNINLLKINSLIMTADFNLNLYKDLDSDKSDFFVPKLSDIEHKFIKTTDETKLYIKDPSLNSPVNKGIFNSIKKDYVSIIEKEIDYVFINRENSIENLDVLSVEEANNVVENIIKSKLNINFENVDDFLSFLKNTCFDVDYLKKDLIVDSDTAYLKSDVNHFESSVNHRAFKHLLETLGDFSYSTGMNPTDNGEIHFSEYDPEKKEALQKAAEILNIDLDFSKNTFGQIFDSLCKLTMIISYPNKENIKKIMDIKEAPILNQSNLIIQRPMFNPVASFGLPFIVFNMPFILEEQNNLTFIRPLVNLVNKNQIQTNFNMPFFVEISDMLTMRRPALTTLRKNMPINSLQAPNVPNPKCPEYDLQIKTDVAPQYILHKRRHRFGMVESYRAFNNIDASYLFREIKSSLNEDYYLCNDCLMKKEVAAILLTYRSIKYLQKECPQIPFRVDFNELFEEIADPVSNSTSSVSNDGFCIISQSDNNNDYYVLGFFSANKKYDVKCQFLSTNTVDFLSVPNFDWELNKLENSDLNFVLKFCNFWKYLTCEEGLRFVIDFNLSDASDRYTDTYEHSSYKFHVNYLKDYIAGTNIGLLNNDTACNKVFDNLDYDIYSVYLVKIFGEDINIPTKLEDNADNLKSGIVGVNYVINDYLLGSRAYIPLSTLKTFHKREKSFVVSNGPNKNFSYLDINAGMFYTTTGKMASIVEKDGVKFISIDDTLIGPVSLDTIHTQDISYENYDLLCDLFKKEDMKMSINPNAYPILAHNIWDILDVNVSAANTLKLNNGVDISDVTESGSNLVSKATIASPLCELYTDEDSILGNYTGNMTLNVLLMDYQDSMFTEIIIDIPISVGVIDGLYSDEAGGELLVLAANQDEVDSFLNEYNFTHKTYATAIDADYLSINDLDDRKEITVDLAEILENVKDEQGNQFTYKNKNLKEILDGELDSVEIKIDKVSFEYFIIKFKSITSDPTNPVAIANANLGLNPVFTTEDESENMIKYSAPYFISGNEVKILIPKREVYETGKKIDFKQKV